MSVAKIKYFPQNPVGMASNKPFVVPSQTLRRNFQLIKSRTLKHILGVFEGYRKVFN